MSNKYQSYYYTLALMVISVIAFVLLVLTIQSQQQRHIIIKQNDLVVCILSDNPPRTEATIKKCREQNR